MEENVSRETFDRVYVRSLASFIGVVSLRLPAMGRERGFDYIYVYCDSRKPEHDLWRSTGAYRGSG